MPTPPSSVPRSYLEVADLWKYSEAEVQWKLAIDWNDAVRLAWAREQHALAFRLGLLRAEHKNSVDDVAVAIGEKRANLTLKLNGHRPATEDDLILWAWLAGVKRQTFTPEALWDQPFRIPQFPFPRARLDR
jgi:hypothetical protein